MKKFLCLMLAFALCISMCAAAEENAGEEAVSNIVTYGPVSLDISDDWVEVDSDVEEFWADAMLSAADNADVYFWLFNKDIWNYELPDEIHENYESAGYSRKDFDFPELAKQLLKQQAVNNNWEADADAIEICQLGEYEFCRLIPEYLENFHGNIVPNPVIYGAIENGYDVTFVFLRRRIPYTMNVFLKCSVQ